MERGENADVLVEVDTLFRKLESMPQNVKQAAFDKIYEKLPCPISRCVFEYSSPKKLHLSTEGRLCDEAIGEILYNSDSENDLIPSCDELSESYGCEIKSEAKDIRKKKKRPGRKPKTEVDKTNTVFRFYGSESHDSEYMVQNIFTSRGRKAKRICCTQINQSHTSSDDEIFEKPKSPTIRINKLLDVMKDKEEWNSNDGLGIKKSKSHPKITAQNFVESSGGGRLDVLDERKEVKQEIDSAVEESELIIDTEASSTENSSAEKLKISPKIETFSCDQCNFHTTNKSLLKSHTRKHTGDRPYACKDCGRAFPQSSGLKVHMKRHRGQRDFPCDYACNYRAYTKVDKIRHMTIHTGERNHVCQYCGKSFAKDSTLREHVKCVHERPDKHVCPKCGFTTFRANNLHVHISMRHRGEYNNHMCPVCGAKVKQRAAFLDHMRSHTGERPYSCHQCDSTFACLARLTVHRKAVHEPRQFTCNVCYKPFQTKHHLLRHLVIHTKEKPFGCPFCIYTCNTQGNVTKHVKTVHNKPDFSYRKHKADQQVDADAKSLKTEWIEKGQKLTEEYLKDLSSKLGRDVTLSELQEREAKKIKRMNEEVEQIKQKRLNRNRKNEHSYHLNRNTNIKTQLEEEAVDEPTALLLNVAQHIPSDNGKLDLEKMASSDLSLESQNFPNLNVDSLGGVTQTIFIPNSVEFRESGGDEQEFQTTLPHVDEHEADTVNQYVSSENIRFCVHEDFLNDEQSPFHVIYQTSTDGCKDRTKDYAAVGNEEYIQNFVNMKGGNEENPTVVVIINTENTDI